MLELFKKRRSIRRFSDKKVTDEQIKQILTVAMWAPSAKHLYPCDFVVVKDQAVRNKFAKIKPSASFANEAPIIIVVIADPAMSRYWLEDGSITAAQIYLAATELGLGTCWIHIRGHKTSTGEEAEAYIRKLLEIPEAKRIICLLPVGYPAEKVIEHSEAEFKEEKVHQERWS